MQRLAIDEELPHLREHIQRLNAEQPTPPTDVADVAREEPAPIDDEEELGNVGGAIAGNGEVHSDADPGL